MASYSGIKPRQLGNYHKQNRVRIYEILKFTWYVNITHSESRGQISINFWKQQNCWQTEQFSVKNKKINKKLTEMMKRNIVVVETREMFISVLILHEISYRDVWGLLM